MVIDSGVEPWREVQEHANLNYDCHCNRIFLPDSSIHLAPHATPCSDYAAHLSIREEALAPPPSPSAFRRHIFLFCFLFCSRLPRPSPFSLLLAGLLAWPGNHAIMRGRMSCLEGGGPGR